MTSNSQRIIQDIRQEFEMLLDFVIGEPAQQATADQIERGLFKLLLAMGAKLLRLFFVMRSEACCREPLQTASGITLAYERDTKRIYYSIFGKLLLYRPYFYKKGGGETPLDAALGLGEDSYSDLVREVSDYLGVYNVYHKSGDILFRLLGLKVSTGAIESNLAEDAADVESYYAQKPAPQPAEEAEILVIQADGKGVPMVLEEPLEPQLRLGKGQKRGRKKEAMVTSIYTMAAHRRTPQAVVDSFFRHNPADTASNRCRPQHKHIWATLDGKDAALARLAQQVARREGPHILARVALCDGYEPLQTRLTKQFPDFTLILDFIHADEYLWAVATSLLGEQHPHRLDWMADYTLKILSGQTQQVIASFQQMAQDKQYTTTQRAQLEKTAAYFQRNLPYMAYDTYLKQGWPIASGVIEGACRHFVKDRCELSGMRWTQTGVENLFRLRAVAENGDWDDYHLFRKRQRHTRLYHQPYPEQLSVEIQAIDSCSLIEKRPDSPTQQEVEPSSSPNHQTLYHLLPLAV
ncbi:MAG: hypothetical protein BroJett011_12410 [Chloroflexota bacterium]|nr:MAG: hypothetical protein BroJett011_12410 [Chloroflexota bacterium]